MVSNKIKNMKQLLSLFLLLLPCLAWAQYPSNGNQKITLGEQTTADGLIWRGRVTDTTLTIKSDTAAYFVLDTVNLNLYTYKASAIGKKWIQLGSDTTSLNLVSRFAAKLNISDTASMLTNYWRAGRFSGTLPIANGGTGASSFSPNNYLIRTNSSGIFDTSAVYEADGNVGIGTASARVRLTTKTQTNSASPTLGSGTIGAQALLSFDGLYGQYSGVSITGNVWHQVQRNDGSTDVYNMIFQPNGGRVGIGTNDPLAQFHVIDVNKTGTTSATNVIQTLRSNGAGRDVYLQFSDNVASNGGIGSINGDFYIAPGGSETVRYTLGGFTGIGTPNPAVQFHTTSNVRFAGLVNYDPVETDADGDIIDGGASDFNLKNSIEPIKDGLNSINQLKPVSYLWNDVNRKLDSTIPDIGFIAQDVMNVIPEAVRSNGDGDLQLNYKAITAILVKAIQEQQALIKALEKRIINLENK
jgi:hypothetical protein